LVHLQERGHAGVAEHQTREVQHDAALAVQLDALDSLCVVLSLPDPGVASRVGGWVG